MCSIVLGQVCVGFGIAQIIDRNHIKLFVASSFEKSSQNVAPNTPVTIYRYLDRHLIFSENLIR